MTEQELKDMKLHDCKQALTNYYRDGMFNYRELNPSKAKKDFLCKHSIDNLEA